MPLDPLPDWLTARRQQVGARIRAARTHAGLTQLELGNRIGRDHRTIHRWEYGQRVPSLDDLLLLADATGIQPQDLFQQPAAGPQG
ncbi:helix-turn-helix transcriptional regulator [Streptomyces pseudovenezuelae]|uniref:helix-turn-helix domain-containing protein n=1 Tax=Streptomyces pseudovenezuelae TaxID=67350 RepID=UPI002E2F1971|nr:helix-turn-helix transcriptional regulator [Streptomyces pseudovenezuelae]